MLLAVMPLPTLEGRCGQLGDSRTCRAGMQYSRPEAVPPHTTTYFMPWLTVLATRMRFMALPPSPLSPLQIKNTNTTASESHGPHGSIEIPSAHDNRPGGHLPTLTHAHSAHGGIHSARRGSREDGTSRWTLGHKRLDVAHGSGIPSEFSKGEQGLPVLKFARHAEGCRAQGAKSPHPSMLADFLTADINLSLQKGRLPLPEDLGENFPRLRAQSASHLIF
jgi:hypothetical protein